MSTGRTYGGESAERRTARRHRQLLDAGLEVFGTVGYSAATVRQVCREAKVADRYFYQEHEGLEDLLLAVYADSIGRLEAGVVAAVEGVGDDVETFTRRALDAFVGGAAADPRLARVIWFEVLGVSPRVERTYLDTMHRLGRLVLMLLEAEGSLPDVEAVELDVVIHAVIGGISHTVLSWIEAGFEPAQSVVVDSLTRFLAGGGRGMSRG